MASVARMIRSLAANGIAVLVVNHAVSAREEGMARGVKPALGVNWQAVPTVRLFLRSDEDDEADEQGGKEGMVWTMEAADGRVLRLNKRVIEVRNSTRTKVGTSGEVYIGSTEIICE